MAPKKTQVLKDWPRPTTVEHVRSFLGLANYFRRFVKDYSKKARPLTQLTRKDTPSPMPWSPEADQAFHLIKEELVNPPVLALPDFSKPFEVITDASNYALGAILLQDGRPVAYESRLLSPAERNYPTHDRECLGIVHAYQVWRCYLEGTDNTCLTDHDPLKYLHNQKTISGRQARWLEFLSSFKPMIKYRPGQGNPSDTLSRPISAGLALTRCHKHGDGGSPTYLCTSRWSGDAQRAADSQPVQSLVPVVRGRLTCGALTLAKPVYADLFKAAYASKDWEAWLTANKAAHPTLRQDGGLWYMTDKLVVPTPLVPAVLKECHDAPYSGHLGITKTKKAVESRFWWPTWKKDTKAYVTTCHSCQANKRMQSKPAGLLKPLPVPEHLWQSVGMDFIVRLPTTQRGHDAILVFVDRLSKMVHLAPCMTSCTAEDAAHLFMQYVYRCHGAPDHLVSDRDTRWESDFWRELCKIMKIEQALSSAFHPQSDGQTERANRVVEDTLRHYISPAQDDWDLLLPCVEFAINSAYQESVQNSPFRLNYGFNPSSPFDVALGLPKPDSRKSKAADLITAMQTAVTHAKRCMEAAQQRQKHYADAKRKPVKFEIDQLVWLSTKNLTLASTGARKFMPRFVGPFKVIAIINEVAVKLELPPTMKIHDVFHVALLKPFKTDGRQALPPPPVIINGQEEFLVEQILQHRQRKRGNKTITEYLVKWVNEGPEHNDWITEGDLTADGTIPNDKLNEYRDQLQQAGTTDRGITTKPATRATTSGRVKHKVVRNRPPPAKKS